VYALATSKFRPLNWWETLLYVVGCYGVASFAASIVASTTATFFVELQDQVVLQEIRTWLIEWAEFYLSWAIQLVFFLVGMHRVSVFRGYSTVIFWSIFPTLGARMWAMLLAASAVWFAIVWGAMFIFFPQQMVADNAFFVGLVGAPFVTFLIPIGVILSPVVEELIFRRMLVNAFAELPVRFIGAAIGSSAIWSLAHWYSWPTTIFVFIEGLVLCFLARRLESIWPGFILHALFNAISFVGIFSLAD
jgi:membrane protease YdiL (CAAX protease family)